MRTRVGWAALVLVVSGCRAITGGDVACTDEARPGLAVTVRDSATGAAVPPAGTTVVAREGAYADTARYGTAALAGAVFSLAYERAGTYAVRVERAGYRAWERTGVRVAAGACHVRTAGLTAALQPLSR